MVEMVVVDGVLVRADELDAYLADHAARPVRYVQESGPRCPNCGSYGTHATTVELMGGRVVNCGSCAATSSVDPATGDGVVLATGDPPH